MRVLFRFFTGSFGGRLARGLFFAATLAVPLAAGFQLDEDFSEAEDGVIPGWRGKYTQEKDGKGFYLKIDRSALGYAQRRIPAQKGKFECSFMVRPDTSPWGWMPQFHGGTKVPVKITFQTNGWAVRANSGYFTRNVARWTPGTWYPMRFVVDVEKQSYTGWFDENQIADNFSFSEEVDAIDMMTFHFPMRDFHVRSLGD